MRSWIEAMLWSFFPREREVSRDVFSPSRKDSFDSPPSTLKSPFYLLVSTREKRKKERVSKEEKPRTVYTHQTHVHTPSLSVVLCVLEMSVLFEASPAFCRFVCTSLHSCTPVPSRHSKRDMAASLSACVYTQVCVCMRLDVYLRLSVHLLLASVVDQDALRKEERDREGQRHRR